MVACRDLDSIFFSIHDERIVNNDDTVRSANRTLQIESAVVFDPGPSAVSLFRRGSSASLLPDRRQLMDAGDRE